MIGYDARMALGGCRGMGLYLRALIGGREDRLLGFCALGEADPTLRLHAQGPRFYPAWEQVSLPQQIARTGVSKFVAPYNTAPLRLPRGTLLALVVHDLIFLAGAKQLPWSSSPYQNAGRLYRRWVVPEAVRRADLLIAVSESTRDAMAEKLGVDEQRVAVIPNSIDRTWFTLPNSPGAAPNVLCIGGDAPNKNLLVALRAFAELEEQPATPRSLRIAVAGVPLRAQAHFAMQARAVGLQKQVEWLPYLTLEQLQKRVQQATAVLVPSRAEGFGRPMLEAMAAGTPVAASRIPALEEVGSGAAHFFDPQNSSAMARALSELLQDRELQTRLRQAGRARAALYHPDAVQPRIDGFWNTLGAAA